MSTSAPVEISAGSRSATSCAIGKLRVWSAASGSGDGAGLPPCWQADSSTTATRIRPDVRTREGYSRIADGCPTISSRLYVSDTDAISGDAGNRGLWPARLVRLGDRAGDRVPDPALGNSRLGHAPPDLVRARVRRRRHRQHAGRHPPWLARRRAAPQPPLP